MCITVFSSSSYVQLSKTHSAEGISGNKKNMTGVLLTQANVYKLTSMIHIIVDVDVNDEFTPILMKNSNIFTPASD